MSDQEHEEEAPKEEMANAVSEAALDDLKAAGLDEGCGLAAKHFSAGEPDGVERAIAADGRDGDNEESSSPELEFAKDVIGREGEESSAAAEAVPSDVAITPGKSKTRHKMPLSKRNKVAICIAAAVVVLAGIGGGVYAHNESVRIEEEKAAAEAEQKEEERRLDYIDNLHTACDYILSGASVAENMGNTTLNVWHSAIFESNPSAWDEEVRPYFSTDFNDALGKWTGSDAFQSQKRTLTDNQKTTKELMSQLTDPPTDCEEAYETLKTLYTDYVSFTNMASDPTGSYTSYSEDFSDMDSKLVNDLELLDTQIPEK